MAAKKDSKGSASGIPARAGSTRTTDSAGDLDTAARARRASRASFLLSIVGLVVATGVAIALPFTTESSVAALGGEYEWSQRTWTAATRSLTLFGVGGTLLIGATALGIGLYGRYLRNVASGSDGLGTLVLTPDKDLGIILSITAPLVMFIVESISMTVVNLMM